MGTLCMPTPPEGRQAYLDHQMNTIPNGRVVKSAQIGGAYYAAVEINDSEEAPEPFTVAVICVSTLHEGGREFESPHADRSAQGAGCLHRGPGEESPGMARRLLQLRAPAAAEGW